MLDAVRPPASQRAASQLVVSTKLAPLSPGCPPACPRASEQPHDKEHEHRARERHDHLADDRVADDLHVDVENGRKEATYKRADDADDDVAEQPQAVTERNAASQKARNETDQQPDQDRVQIQVYCAAIDRNSHVYSSCRRRNAQVSSCP